MEIKVEEMPQTKTIVNGKAHYTGLVRTDGKSIKIHPRFLEKLDDDQIGWFLKHEVLHKALKHHLLPYTLREGLPYPLLNIAADLAVNCLIEQDEGSMVSSGLLPGQGDYAHLKAGECTEYYVAQLTKDWQDKQQQQQREAQQAKSDKSKGEKGSVSSRNGVSDDGDDWDDDGSEAEASDEKGKGRSRKQGKGDGDEPEQGEGDEQGEEQGESSPEEMTEQDWKTLKPDECGIEDVSPTQDLTPEEAAAESQRLDNELIRAVAEAKAAGQGNAMLEQTCEALVKPTRLPLKQILQQFVRKSSKGGFSYKRPSRRHSTLDGIYPAHRQKTLDTLLVAVDTSGSMGSDEINRVLDLVSEVLRIYPGCKISMVECGTYIPVDEDGNPQIRTVDRWNVAELRKDVAWHGRGGTDLRPPFVLAEKLGNVQCIVYLTDLMGPQPDSCKIPTLWISTDQVNKESHYYPKFGMVTSLLDDDVYAREH
jgi:predicted metal-dependent peptidase